MIYSIIYLTVIRFVSISDKFGICTVVGPNGTLVEAKIRILWTIYIIKSKKMSALCLVMFSADGNLSMKILYLRQIVQYCCACIVSVSYSVFLLWYLSTYLAHLSPPPASQKSNPNGFKL